MKFLKSLFSKNVPFTPQPVDTPSLVETIEKYHEQVLEKFIRERAEGISRFATWEMNELTEAIQDYKEELAYCRITETPSMCNIFEERIYQLNAAREILEKSDLSIAG